jgi:hypothetical protein
MEKTRRLTPIERSLYLIALDLEPRLSYTYFEIQSAWRRMGRAHPDAGGNGVAAAAAVNAAYVALVSQPELFHHVDIAL